MPILALSARAEGGWIFGSKLSKTGLYDFHVANGAKMVPFAGYSMPLQYGDVGGVAAHNHVRTQAGLFDVGHMVQSFITGPSATAFLEWLTPSALAELKAFHSTLSVLLNDKGGIIDDTVICKHSDDKYYVVTNAGRRVEDLAWFEQKLKEWNASDKSSSGKVSLEVLDGWGLVALQGKSRRENGTFIGASTVLQRLKDGPSKRRVGFVIADVPAREGAKVFSPAEEEIGVITSGIPSPTLSQNIAMGYIKNGFHKKGTEVLVEVRKKMRKATVKPMPFVPAKYHREP
ncbi:Aminomethyltransferase, mitochondrial [Tulasnella sp. UAMH 9824]|nr:Aminomethyltransferase, mitochondrial [Tulasnella sp. UAMH 9824]